jgi:type IV pilus assembly protein PilM
MAEGKLLVGVDIGASSIKVVHLKESRRALTIVRYGHIELPRDTIIDGHVMNPSAVTEALQQVFASAKISQKEVAVGVYGQSVIVRKIAMPLMTKEELAESIGWEAEQHIPFDIKQMSYDYEVLARFPEEQRMDVLLVAAKRDEVSDVATVVRDAKLKPLVVDINAFAMQNALERSLGALPTDRTIAVVDVGAANTTINVLSKGTSAFTREIQTAGATITEEVRKRCNLGWEQAEAYKCGAQGGLVPQDVNAAIDQACANLAGEVHRSLDFYLATSGEADITRIYLCGGGASLAPLSRAIEEKSRRPVEVFDPTSAFEIDSKVDADALRARGSQLAVALGLALRRTREVRA